MALQFLRMCLYVRNCSSSHALFLTYVTFHCNIKSNKKEDECLYLESKMGKVTQTVSIKEHVFCFFISQKVI